MRSPSRPLPVRMSRVAVVVPTERLREALVVLAGQSSVELVGTLPAAEGPAAEALHRVEHDRPGARGGGPCVLADPPDLDALEAGGERDLLAGEVELQRRAALAVEHGSFAAFIGWTPTEALPELEARLGAIGGAAVEMPAPAWTEPPTLLTSVPVARPFQPIVKAYGVSRYADVDPTLFAGFAFVLMFGIMFGDVGHGLVLAALGLLLGRVRRGRLAGIQPIWPLVTAAGLTAAFFGLLYGEAFGPTGIVPRLWIDPLEEPVPLLVLALVVGLALLAVSHGFGIVNRYREEGAATALLAPSGLAGLFILLGGAAAVAGLLTGRSELAAAGGIVALVGVALLGLGFVVSAGGGAAGVAQAGIELVNSVVRIASNAVSFTRLAAFGILHSALGLVVFAAVGALWGGPVGSVAAVLVFVLGNVAAFGIGFLVTAVQALRLEFYELFSRIFAGEGRPFRPWSLPVVQPKEET
jgi:V/A-type H+-transporting ATPase subunit I